MNKHQQKGITLIGAIFIMVIIGMLGQSLISITSSQRQTSLLALQSARAYQAANAGIEWAIAQAVTNNSCAASTAITLPNSNFTVTVQCTNQGNFTEDDETTTIFALESTSEFNSFGSADYVSRTIQTTINR